MEKYKKSYMYILVKKRNAAHEISYNPVEICIFDIPFVV